MGLSSKQLEASCCWLQFVLVIPCIPEFSQELFSSCASHLCLSHGNEAFEDFRLCLYKQCLVHWNCLPLP